MAVHVNDIIALQQQIDAMLLDVVTKDVASDVAAMIDTIIHNEQKLNNNPLAALSETISKYRDLNECVQTNTAINLAYFKEVGYDGIHTKI